METFVGDIVTLSFETGVDLSNTNLSILYRKPNGVTGSWTGILNPADHTIVYYITNVSDLNMEGTWKLQVYANSVTVNSHGTIVILKVKEPIPGYTVATTAAPTTISITTPIPTTITPTTLASTVSPTTTAPTTLAPTASPTTLAPTPAPTTLAPTTLLTTLAPTTVLTTTTPTTVTPPTLPPTTAEPFDLGEEIHLLSTTSTFSDTDEFVLARSATYIGLKVLWSTIKSALKTYFDTLYNNYVHPTGDGNLHVPATGTTNNGKILTAGSTAGSLSWQTAGAISGFLQINDFSFTDGVSNFPAATKGDFLQATNEGWLGGAAGVGEYINESDILYCNTTTAAGTKAVVWQNWNLIKRIIAQPNGYRYVEMVSNTSAPTGIINGYYFLNDVMYKVQNGVHTAI